MSRNTTMSEKENDNNTMATQTNSAKEIGVSPVYEVEAQDTKVNQPTSAKEIVTKVETEIEEDDDSFFEVVSSRRHARNNAKGRNVHSHQYHGGGDPPMNGRRGGNNFGHKNYRYSRYNDLNGHQRRGFPGEGRGPSGVPGPNSTTHNHPNGISNNNNHVGGGLITPGRSVPKKGHSSSSICSESSFTDSSQGMTSSSSGASDESGESPVLIGDNPSEISVASSGSITGEATVLPTGEEKREDESVEIKPKYIDAPPPVVNPWRVNSNAASVLAKKVPTKAKQEPLTPAKAVNGVKTPVPASAPKASAPPLPPKAPLPTSSPAQPSAPPSKPAPVKLQPASAKDPWDINRIKRLQESTAITVKVAGEDWPALKATIEEVKGNMTSLTLECKIVNLDSSSTGSADSIEEELESANGKLDSEKWPLISSGDNPKCMKGTRKDGSNDDVLPALESSQSARQKHASGDENGSGSTSVSSDDTVAEGNRDGSTDEIEIPTRKSKKSAKLKWVPLKLPETVTPKNRTKRDKSQKFKSARYERGESPSGSSPGRGRGGRGGSRGRGGGRNSRNSHQYFFPENTDPNVIPPANPRDDYTDYPPDFTTLAPVFTEASEFIMPYVADNFYGNSYVQPSDPAITATTPAVSFVPVGMEDALLVELLRQQIEYYFSEENLEKDFYLRRKMDSEGYLPIKLIASFQRVQNMTHDYNIVISAILSSQTLQVKEDMTCVRTMITPTKWPIADTLYLAVSTSSDFPCPVSSQVPSSVPNGVVLSEPRSIQAV